MKKVILPRYKILVILICGLLLLLFWQLISPSRLEQAEDGRAIPSVHAIKIKQDGENITRRIDDPVSMAAWSESINQWAIKRPRHNVLRVNNPKRYIIEYNNGISEECYIDFFDDLSGFAVLPETNMFRQLYLYVVSYGPPEYPQFVPWPDGVSTETREKFLPGAVGDKPVRDGNSTANAMKSR